MSDDALDLAEKLESLLPEAIRLLFRPKGDDPIAELPVAQIRVMRQLYSGRDTPSALGDTLAMSISAVTQVVNRMVAAGLVHRSEDPDDRRVRRLRLSDKGVRMMSVRHAERVGSARDALRLLSEPDRQRVVDALEMLVRVCASRTAATSDPNQTVATERNQDERMTSRTVIFP